VAWVCGHATGLLLLLLAPLQLLLILGRFSFEAFSRTALDLLFGFLDGCQPTFSTGQLIRNVDLRFIFGIGTLCPPQQFLIPSAQLLFQLVRIAPAHRLVLAGNGLILVPSRLTLPSLSMSMALATTGICTNRSSSPLENACGK